MHFKKILMLLVSLALIGATPQVVADHHEKTDGVAQVAYITAKEGHAQALEEAITAYHHDMGKKEGALRYTWYSIISGPNTGSYLARTGNHNYADFDATHDWQEAADAAFAKDVSPHIADTIVTFTKTDDELGMWPDSMEGYELISVTQWHIKQGKGKAFNDGLKKIDAALKAGNWPSHYAFIYPISGGKGNTVMLVSPRKNFADMAPKEPSFEDIMGEAMGDDFAGFMSEWATTYQSGQNQLIRYRAELSDYGD